MSADFEDHLQQLATAERFFRAEWLVNAHRTESGAPVVSPDYASRQGTQVRFIDLRERAELLGPLGYIPGTDWVPEATATSLAQMLSTEAHVVLVSTFGQRSEGLARELEASGHPFIASLQGGMSLWKELGFGITRDPSIVSRRGVLRPMPEAVPDTRALTADEVRAHVKDPDQVRTIRMAALLVHARLSCVDGRDASGVIGTPGGDLGETLLALSALEQLTGQQLDERTLTALLQRRLDTFGRFYLHTDFHAAQTFATALRADRRFDQALAGFSEPRHWTGFLRSPPAHLREPLLEHLLVPAHVGCGHVKLVITRAHDYGVRAALPELLLRAFWRAYWDGGDPEHVILFGGHGEQAVLNIRLEDEVRAFSAVPLVSPLVAGRQVFVNHPQVSTFIRHELAHFLLRQTDLLRTGGCTEAALDQAIDALAQRQLGLTLSALAKGLPVFDVTFGKHGGVRAEATGVV